jgi:tetratricopeptide (TPR) repeat protein
MPVRFLGRVVVRLRTNLTWCGLGSVLLLIAGTGPSRAAPPDAGQDLTPTARELSDQALRHYQQGEYDAAIEAFMGAFALSNNSGLLFNVAQAYRLKGDCEHARDYYQRFLGAVPETPLKPSLERRVAEMEECLKSRAAEVAAAAPEETASAPVAGVVTTPAAPSLSTAPVLVSPTPELSPSRRAAVWTLRGSAVASLAASAVFGALSWDAYRDFQRAPTRQLALDPSNRYTTNTALTWTFAASGVACAVLSYLVGRAR